MGLDCGAKCLKWMLISFNILFWLCGAAMMGTGIWMAVDEEAFEILDITNPEGMEYTVWKAAVYTMIGVGAFVFLIGFLGFAGAMCQNRCMLMTYSILAGIAFAAEVACAVLALIYQDEIDSEVAAQMYDDLTIQYTTANDPSNSYVTTWNNFQSKMACCGSYNFTDWHKNQHYGGFGQDSVPWTCCRMSEVSDPPEVGDVIAYDECMTEGSGTDPTQQPNFSQLHNVGCHVALKQWLEDKSVIIYGVMFGVMAIQIFGVVFGCMLFCAIDKNRNYA